MRVVSKHRIWQLQKIKPANQKQKQPKAEAEMAAPVKEAPPVAAGAAARLAQAVVDRRAVMVEGKSS